MVSPILKNTQKSSVSTKYSTKSWFLFKKIKQRQLWNKVTKKTWFITKSKTVTSKNQQFSQLTQITSIITVKKN